MIFSESRTREHCRKVLISGFVVFHFWILSMWILPPFSEMVNESQTIDGFARSLERETFNALQVPEQGFLSRLSRGYIDLIGAHQYWDFFAPDSPRVHRYLSVCSDIREYAQGSRIDCIDPLYRSFDGEIEDAGRPHHGIGSRSFRLVENLVRVNRPDLLDAFTNYWRKKHKTEDTRTAFVLLHEFTLHPESPDPESANERSDQVFWIAPE